MAVYLLDARTKDGNLRMTSFAEDGVLALYRDFTDWVRDNEITNEDLWFARIFEAKGPRHIGNLRLDDDGSLIKEPAPIDSPITLKDSRYTLGVRLKYMLNML